MVYEATLDPNFDFSISNVFFLTFYMISALILIVSWNKNTYNSAD